MNEELILVVWAKDIPSLGINLELLPMQRNSSRRIETFISIAKLPVFFLAWLPYLARQ
jgi:hypothetical protein